MKAVIPVAGLGTRMLPATKAIPKEMLPLADKPIIQYVVNECVLAGITEIVLVTHSSKNAIENHFDTSFELESTLEKRVKRKLLMEVKNCCPPEATLIHVRQGEAKGLGHAVLTARPVVGNEPFVVLLPDILIDSYTCNLKKDNLSAMVSNYLSYGKSQVMVERVDKQDVENYGIVDLGGVKLKHGETAKIKSVVEKPSVDDAPSDFSITGRYVFSPAIWDILEYTPPGVGGEVQLTDAMAVLLKEEPVEAYRLVGTSHDCGNKLGYMKAFVDYCLRHPDYGQDLSKYIESLSAPGYSKTVVNLDIS